MSEGYKGVECQSLEMEDTTPLKQKAENKNLCSACFRICKIRNADKYICVYECSAFVREFVGKYNRLIQDVS
jgi:hypothetical protein